MEIRFLVMVVSSLVWLMLLFVFLYWRTIGLGSRQQNNILLLNSMITGIIIFWSLWVISRQQTSLSVLPPHPTLNIREQQARQLPAKPREVPRTTHELVSETSPHWLQGEPMVIDQSNLEEYLLDPQRLPANFIVASSRWSSREEAVQETRQLLDRLLQHKIQAEFAPHYSSEVIRAVLEKESTAVDVTAEYVEPHQLQLNDGLQADMIRLYWQVHVTAESQQKLAMALREQVVQKRLKYTAGGVGLFALMCGGVSLLLTRKQLA